MKTRSDGPGDLVATFDAFKIARWGGARAASWTVEPLTPWALLMLTRYADTMPPHERPQWRRHSRTERIIGATFDRRSDALDFLRAAESHAGVWS